MRASLHAWARGKRVELVVFAAMGGVYFFTNLQRVGVPGTFFNELQTEFGATASQVTALGAVFFYVYAAMQVFVGAGADRFGPERMVLAGGALLVAGSFLFPTSHSMEMLYVARALTGLGASFMYVSVIKAIVNMFDSRHFPPLLGGLLVIGYSGGLVATAPLERAVAAFGWRHTFIAAAVACLVAYMLVLLLVARMKIRRSRGPGLTLQAVKGFFATRGVYPILISGAINFAMYYVLQVAVGKKFLEDCRGLSSSAAALLTFLMLGTTVAAYLVSGFLPRLAAERRRPFVIASSIGTLAGCAGLAAGMAAGAPAWWFAVCYVVLAAANAPAIVGTTLLKELCPPSVAGLAISILNGACYAGIAVSSSVAGLVLDLFSGAARKGATGTVYPPEAYTWMFAGMTALAAISLVVSFFAPETGGVQRAESVA